jgi:hypothetical protein
MPALPRISWCADKGFLYFDIERKKYTIPVLHCYREFTQNLGQPLYVKFLVMQPTQYVVQVRAESVKLSV